MNIDEYKAHFAEPEDAQAQTEEVKTRAGRALLHALDIRKFEIELYWKRATYFWTLIAAAFAAYALTYKAATPSSDSWLSIVFAELGLVLSFAWYLVNRGSKFWQNNWERHVDMLEDMTVGPLYKIVAHNHGRNLLTDAAQFSVTKINQMLSLFITIFWMILLTKSIGPISAELAVDYYKILTVALTLAALIMLWRFGRSSLGNMTTSLVERKFDVRPS